MSSTLNIEAVKMNDAETAIVDSVIKKLDESLKEIKEIKIDIPEPDFIKEAKR